uniref:Secreted protein n=1 Tax=Ixodes scapularis TaxID=6945 RepID=A0A4D5RCE3_IXOSC
MFFSFVRLSLFPEVRALTLVYPVLPATGCPMLHSFTLSTSSFLSPLPTRRLRKDDNASYRAISDRHKCRMGSTV